MTAVLAARGLAKKFCPSPRRALAYGVADAARELLPFESRSAGLRKGEFWAVDDVSFELAAGESLAILGHNGAGKSTLLRLLAGIIRPDRGEARLRGRVGAVLELGAGLNPLLSARENILLAAAVHGLGAGEGSRLVDPVIAFAELEGRFVDTPVQTYSSGMRARTAYAIRACLEYDVLLVDEALAVGDHAFQRKCVRHMMAFLERGGALLLVSHNAHHAQAVCRRGLLLDHGRTAFAGSAVDAIARMFDTASRVSAPLLPSEKAEEPRDFEILETRFEGEDGADLVTARPARLRLRYRNAVAREARWGFSIWTDDRWVLLTGDNDPQVRTLAVGEGELSCRVPRLPLMPGHYWLRALVEDARTTIPLVRPRRNFVGVRVVAEPDSRLNLRRHFGQLTAIEVDWR